MTVVLLQLFWVSFVLVGGSLLLWLKRKHVGGREAYRAIAGLPLGGIALVAFAFGLASFAAPIAIAYIFRLPTDIISGLYGISLIVAAIYAVRQRKSITELLRARKPQDMRHWLALIAVLVALGLDYGLSLKWKAPLQWDAAVHIARANLVAQGHFSLADPFMGNHGLVDPRYSTNLFLGFEGVAARILHTTALSVWLNSYALVRLSAWLSFFVLTWSFLNKQVRRRWSYVVLILAPFFLNYIFIEAEFPDRLVLVWIALGLVGVKLWLESKNALLLFVACLLIATTHSLYALMFAGFLALVMCGIAISRHIERRQLLEGGGLLALLLLPVALNLYYPDLIKHSATAFNAGAISGNNFVPHRYGPFTINAVPYTDYFDLAIYAVVAACFYLAVKVRRVRYRRIIVALAILIALIQYTPALVSLAGYSMLWSYSANRKARWIILGMVLYYGLIVYNPIAVKILNGTLPPWAIARFQEINLFSWIASVIAWLGVVEFPRQAWRDVRFSRVLFVAAVPLYIWLAVPMLGPAAPSLVFSKLWRTTDIARNQAMVDAFQHLQPLLAHQMIYTSDPGVSFYIPTVINGAHVLTTLDTNYSPMANIVRRDQCGKLLAKNMSANDLAAAGVTRIIAHDYSVRDAYSHKFDKVYDPLDHVIQKPYLKLIGQTAGFRVYAVHILTTPRQASICRIPWGQ